MCPNTYGTTYLRGRSREHRPSPHRVCSASSSDNVPMFQRNSMHCSSIASIAARRSNASNTPSSPLCICGKLRQGHAGHVVWFPRGRGTLFLFSPQRPFFLLQCRSFCFLPVFPRRRRQNIAPARCVIFWEISDEMLWKHKRAEMRLVYFQNLDFVNRIVCSRGATSCTKRALPFCRLCDEADDISML